ncbi:MAG: lytic transglycosylase domain-containing protein [Cyanobacteria bacterium SIG26]|nr:lytic transglycosylase domain-containing protein [Cyanobacteria bacterium SIG26]
MKKLLLFTIALMCMLCAPVQAANVNTIKAAIVRHSIEMGVDPAITLSIAKTESGFRQEARSSHGAVGVFQLMPSTARRMGLNAYSLDDNIKGGIMYYKSMYKMFGSMELALAAYNAGPGNVKKYRAIPPFSETRRFVSKIMTDYRNFKSNPDPAMVAAQNLPSSINGAQVLATSPSVVPMVKIEQARNLNMELVKEIPIEVEVKSQSVAI